jgi:glycosyltransferase domain-containing protein
VLSKITLVIPTFNNRHHYLRRILDYYRELQAGFEIIIADSSPLPFAEAKEYAQLTYLHCKDMSYTGKLFLATGKITTPYAVLCADDDFIAPSALETCIRFLDQHRDYASVQGHLVAFPVPGKIKPIPWMFQIAGLDIADEKATERILHFFKYHIYLHYSVHRTANLYDTFRLSKDFTDTFAGGTNEYFLDIISLINGKHKVLPIFYAAQELTKVSGRNSITGLTRLRNMEQYQSEYRQFLEKITCHLAAYDPAKMAVAGSFVDEFFHKHPFFQVQHVAESPFAHPLSGPVFRRIKNMVDKINGVQHVKSYYSKTLYFLRGQREESRKKQTIKDQIRSTKNFAGFPFYDNDAIAEWKKIEVVIRKHQNLNARS